MQTYFIDFILLIGVAVAAMAVGGVCVVGVLVWLSGRKGKAPK